MKIGIIDRVQRWRRETRPVTAFDVSVLVVGLLLLADIRRAELIGKKLTKSQAEELVTKYVEEDNTAKSFWKWEKKQVVNKVMQANSKHFVEN